MQETSLAVVNEPTRELARQPELIRPLASIAMLDAHRAEMKAIVGKLREGVDYGKIPGTNKDTLYKAGAELLCFAYGLSTRLVVVEQQVEHDTLVEWRKRNGQKGDALGCYRYVIRCELVSRATGEVVGMGVGSCSTLESKYAERPRDVENTILKMAKKRALVDAVLTSFALSDRFIQDMEDMQHEEEPERTPQPTRQPTQVQRPTQSAPMNGNGKARYAALWTRAQAKGMTVDDWVEVCKPLGVNKDNLTPVTLAALEELIDAWSPVPDDCDPATGERIPDEVLNGPPTVEVEQKARPSRVAGMVEKLQEPQDAVTYYSDRAKKHVAEKRVRFD